MDKRTARLTDSERFISVANQLKAQRGGAPVASIVNGQVVFTYPDGTVTVGGKVQ